MEVVNAPLGLDLTLMCSLSGDPDNTAKNFYFKLLRSTTDGNVETCLEIDYKNIIKTIYNKDLNIALLVIEFGLDDTALRNRVLEIISRYMASDVSKKISFAGKEIFIWGEVKVAMEQYRKLK